MQRKVLKFPEAQGFSKTSCPSQEVNILLSQKTNKIHPCLQPHNRKKEECMSEGKSMKSKPQEEKWKLSLSIVKSRENSFSSSVLWHISNTECLLKWYEKKESWHENFVSRKIILCLLENFPNFPTFILFIIGKRKLTIFQKFAQTRKSIKKKFQQFKSNFPLLKHANIKFQSSKRKI